MLDEVPVFLMRLLKSDPTEERARQFLATFRTLRQGNADQEADAVHWILAGSIGLDTLARRYRMTTEINDLQPFELGPFTPEMADEFLRAMGVTEGLELQPDVRSRICEKAEWLIPHHLHVLFNGLRDRCEDARSGATVDLVDAAFEALLGHAYRSYFDPWYVRLTDELGPPEDGYARRLLSVAARDTRGALLSALSQSLAREIPDANARREALLWLLDALARDGYLVKERDRWRFRSPLLREYWRRALGG
jgi:uncharacterized protein